MGDELGLATTTEAKARFNALSYFYIGFATVWTICIVSASIFLLINRSTPVLRHRGILTSILSIVFLHLYWTSVQLAYTLGPLYPGNTQYWIMGTWFPLGVALFHGNNARFLHVADKQRKFMERRAGSVEDVSTRSNAWKRLSYTKKLFISVGIGMAIQFFFTALFYIISRKWHASWGIPGTEVTGTEMEIKAKQGTGWEWVPSTLWQFTWAWIVAPYVLWKSRGIHDTQGWRVQTVGCCLASLHASPMWLIALYVPAFEKINTYWIPPQWIAISIMAIEIFTLFIPCFQVIRHRTLERETLDSIAQWEEKNKNRNNSTSRSHVTHRTTASTMVESMLSGFRSTSEESAKALPSYEGILTMAALEHVLERKPEPLQQFAALRDFSGENIAFLTTLAQWKNDLPPPSRFSRRGSDSVFTDPQDFIRDRFVKALKIYVDYISDSHAELQVNLASNETRKLDAVFGPAAKMVYGERRTSHSIAPFDVPMALTKPSLMVVHTHEIEVDAISSNGSEKMTMQTDSNVTHGSGVFTGEVPAGFDEMIFDEAEKSIKYLVLTNTWPKFVKDRRTSMDSFESLDSGNSVLQMLRERYRVGAATM